jgi:hypothetical protein
MDSNLKHSFNEIPPDYEMLMSSWANGLKKTSSTTYYKDSSAFPICTIGFENRCGMTIQCFIKGTFSVDSVQLINEYSRKNNVILYKDMSLPNNNRWLSLENPKSIDNLTIRSIPKAKLFRKNYAYILELNDVKTFSYELNHLAINNFNISRTFAKGGFAMVILEHTEKVYLITLSNVDYKEGVSKKLLDYLNFDI